MKANNRNKGTLVIKGLLRNIVVVAYRFGGLGFRVWSLEFWLF